MTAISPVRGRFDYGSAMHPTSSLRDPLPNATPPAPSRSPSTSGPRDGDDRDDRRKGKGRERDELAEEDTSRPEKRSRHGRPGGSGGRHSGDSPSKASASGRSPKEEEKKSSRPTLAPIKPIGFAASREARREDGTDRAIPSPVVMGFDFKSIDEEQLKTVRDTISIKEQQQALIAQRRKEMAASQPTTPRELTFKGWTPKETDKRGGVGARREKTRDKVAGMSIVTSATDKDVVPGSKSAPLNQGLASQQQSPREPPSGSQTAMPQHILPPMHYNHPHTAHHLDPRTAPIGRRMEDSSFARQQQPYYQQQQQQQPPTHRSSGSMSASTAGPRSQDPRYPPDLGPRSGRQPQPNTADRRNFPVPGLQTLHSAHSSRGYPPSPHAPQSSGPQGPPAGPPSGRPSNGVHRGNGYSLSPSPPNLREQFLAPFSQLYDLLGSVDQLRFQLQEMMHRSEQAYTSQMAATNDFKQTAANANSLLSTLQQSAESLKEMVRYEVERSSSADRRELDELRDRLRSLEDRVSR